MKHASYAWLSNSSFKDHEQVKDSSLLFITLLVCILHVLVFCFFQLSPPIVKSREVKQKIAVKTIKLNPHLQPLTSMAESTPVNLASEKHAFIQTTQELNKEAEKKIEVEREIEQSPAIPLKLETTPSIETPHFVSVNTEPSIQNPPKINPPIPKKIEPKKIETKPISKTEAKNTTPKPLITEDKKIVSEKKPAPIKKAVETPTKPVKIKEPTPEEIAAKEAERLRQKELEAAKEAARVRQQQLLAKAKENLAKIGESRDKISANKLVSLDETTIPKQLENLQIDALPTGTQTSIELTGKEISYRDEIAYRLKLALKLPDYGAIKIKLTLERSGKVASIQVIQSESEKNKQYIEKSLPLLLFPAFGNNFAQSSQYTFLITLNND